MSCRAGICTVKQSSPSQATPCHVLLYSHSRHINCTKPLILLPQNVDVWWLPYAGLLHPTINVDNPEAEVDMSVIVGAEKQSMEVNVGLSNSFGFGGHNSSILFSAFRE